jgi:hypothetical protein
VVVGRLQQPSWTAEVGTSSLPGGLWLAAIPAQAGSFPLLDDGFVQMPQVGTSAPLGMTLTLGMFVDSHHPHPSPRRHADRRRPPTQSTLGAILPADRSRVILLLG